MATHDRTIPPDPRDPWGSYDDVVARQANNPRARAETRAVDGASRVSAAGSSRRAEARAAHGSTRVPRAAHAAQQVNNPRARANAARTGEARSAAARAGAAGVVAGSQRVADVRRAADVQPSGTQPAAGAHRAASRAHRVADVQPASPGQRVADVQPASTTQRAAGAHVVPDPYTAINARPASATRRTADAQSARSSQPLTSAQSAAGVQPARMANAAATGMRPARSARPGAARYGVASSSRAAGPFSSPTSPVSPASPAPLSTTGVMPRKRSPWRIVFWVALVVLVVSLACLGYLAFTYWNGQRAYDDIADASFTAPADASSTTLADFDVDWDALRAINPDVVGWVYVPDTSISYPIVHREHDDAYYLNHNFNNDTAGQFGAEFGCIMLSGENQADFSDDLNVVYGHNMTNGSMFSQFAQFADSVVFNEHRTIYVLTPEGNYLLNTIALDRVLGTDTNIVIPTFSSSDDLADYVQKRLDASIVQPDPAAPAASDVAKLFAFSTCDNSNDIYRFVTFAEVVDYLPAGASVSAGDAGALVNPDDVAGTNSDAKERVS